MNRLNRRSSLTVVVIGFHRSKAAKIIKGRGWGSNGVDLFLMSACLLIANQVDRNRHLHLNCSYYSLIMLSAISLSPNLAMYLLLLTTFFYLGYLLVVGSPCLISSKDK
jgi:hypothetical protein